VAGLALALVALLMVAGCSSDGGAGGQANTTETVSATDGAAGSPTTGGPAAPGASTGPDGVGRVVATSDGAGTYVDISPDELAAMLESKDLVFINTHVPYEGEIEPTDLFLPYDQAAEMVAELPPDKNAKLVVYCRSDRMSRIAIEEWVKAGYTNLYNLDGGFVAWVVAGYELLQK
jgi:rhodanese-related sulfurtransferase